MRPADLDDVLELVALLGERRVQVLERRQSSRTACSAAATCIAVGKVSFEDWPRLTWSLGCTGALPPRSPPSISLARLAITSLAFMLVWVPEPVCQTTSGNSSVSLPSATSCAARRWPPPSLRSSSPEPPLTLAAASLTMPERPDQGRRHALAADLEVLQGALGLGTPVAVRLDLDRSERVGLDANVLGAVHAAAPVLLRCAAGSRARRACQSSGCRRAGAGGALTSCGSGPGSRSRRRPADGAVPAVLIPPPALGPAQELDLGSPSAARRPPRA